MYWTKKGLPLPSSNFWFLNFEKKAAVNTAVSSGRARCRLSSSVPRQRAAVACTAHNLGTIAPCAQPPPKNCHPFVPKEGKSHNNLTGVKVCQYQCAHCSFRAPNMYIIISRDVSLSNLTFVRPLTPPTLRKRWRQRSNVCFFASHIWFLNFPLKFVMIIFFRDGKTEIDYGHQTYIPEQGTRRDYCRAGRLDSRTGKEADRCTKSRRGDCATTRYRKGN